MGELFTKRPSFSLLEPHHSPVYSVSFAPQWVSMSCKRGRDYFATVGAKYMTTYACIPKGAKKVQDGSARL